MIHEIYDLHYTEDSDNGNLFINYHACEGDDYCDVNFYFTADDSGGYFNISCDWQGDIDLFI